MTDDETVSRVLSALADPTRRRILDALVRQGSSTATVLAQELPVTRQAIVKHLGVLDRAGRKLDEYEFQMLYGIRSEEHVRLAAEGHRMRVYTAYGTDWYGYFMRRLAEKPANLLFFVRSMITKN
ncbi:proline dehydrogenase family protein [Streptomyces clavuligerus]|uniref:proline dehydrogenase family protein n=1 Tax=Streptomyces clavuligerus TaxID=1901 RepID=UPI001E3CC0BF